MAARWSSPSGAQWTIRFGSHEATVTEVGGGLREYLVDGEPVVEGYAAESIAPSGAGQVLTPWPNRIADGRYSFGGVDYQLPVNEVARNTAIHGLVRWLPWQRVDQSPESIALSCVLVPHPGYPFALEFTTRYIVDKDGLRAEHTAVNLSPDTAPFGFGTHPYFRVGDTSIDDLVLHLPATERLVTTDDRLLPVRREPVADTRYDFTTPRKFGDLEIDSAFTGLVRDADGIARIRLSAVDGPGVEVWQDAAFGWVQIYSGSGPAEKPRRTLAIEPNTAASDAFNTGDGLISLASGERWRGVWGVTPVR